MNILIVNGSPKGENSITLQTCLYIRKHFPAHNYAVLDAGSKVHSLQKDFSPALQDLAVADLIIFSYPVYTFLAPSQLHSFISQMKTACSDGALSLEGKVATQITTSKHFYDVTAHRYVRDNCADMGLNFISGLSADMDDLLSREGRSQAKAFFSQLLWKIERGYFDAPSVKPVDYNPALATVPAQTIRRPARGKKIALVSDIIPGDAGLKAMIDRFVASVPYECEIVNIREFPFKGGCLSCFNCAADGSCVYNDGFDRLLRDKVQSCCAIVYAFRIVDHSMGLRFKMYDDRQFCNGHRTVTEGTPFAYLVSGPLSSEENLRTVIEARAQVGGNYLAGIASDETDPDTQIDRMVECLCYAISNGYSEPRNFYGVGGMKIFRDLIYTMRGMMRADHRFFRKHRQYDFPQKQCLVSMKMYLVGWLMRNKKLKAKAGDRISEGMIAPYKKALEK